MHDPDAQLLRRAQRGDQWAFGELAERHQPRLFTLAARIVGSRDDAAAVVQDALVRAWLALPRFCGGSLFSTWLYRICLNAAYDHRSKRRPDAAEVEERIADPRDRFVESELSGELQRALNALDEVYRVAVVLYDVLGCSYAEIAELTEVAEGTVKSRIFRGRAELARHFGTSPEADESKDR